MHGNPEKCMGIPKMPKILKKIKNLAFSLDAREYRKFGNPEREYRIPELPVPGKFGNTKFPKNSHSRTSVFPKANNSGMAPS